MKLSNVKTRIQSIRFAKMHGLGNDFVVIDGRKNCPNLSMTLIRSLADRHFGIGFDQLALISSSKNPSAEEHLNFWNSDGSTSSTCGNATRCIARVLMDEKHIDTITLSSDHGAIHCKRGSSGIVSVNMGFPITDWSEIPLAYKCNSLHLPIKGDPVGTSMGNPHCTFFVEDIEENSIFEFGKRFETDNLFPERTNVQIAQVIGNGRIRMKVWERGVGPTLASGSSACAVAVAAIRRGLTGNKNSMILDGGILDISWEKDGVWMAGETSYIYDGVISDEFFDKLRDRDA